MTSHHPIRKKAYSIMTAARQIQMVVGAAFLTGKHSVKKETQGDGSMSNIKRYDPMIFQDLEEVKEGEYVKHSDHESVVAGLEESDLVWRGEMLGCMLACKEKDSFIAELVGVMSQLRREVWRIDNHHFLIPYTDKLITKYRSDT